MRLQKIRRNYRTEKKLRKLDFFIGVVLLIFLPGAFDYAKAEDSQIRLNFATFDPLVEVPSANVPARLLSKRSDSDQGADNFIVQFHHSPLPADQQSLKDLGVEIRSPLHDHALIVFMDGTARAKVESSSSVRWVGRYETWYKYEDGLMNRSDPADATQASQPIRYSIVLFGRGAPMQQIVADRVQQLGGSVDLLTENSRMEATFDATALDEIAQMPEVLFIERWTPDEDDMDLVRSSNGANFLETVENYTGQGVRGEVFDDGVRIGHRDFQLNPLLIHGSNDSDNNHGTPTFGIVFGSGASDSRARGMLPDAEQPIFSSRHRFSDRFAHAKQLVDPDGPYRAVFQTSSWGSSRSRNYTSKSREMDEIIFNLDILITQSQSNAGNRDSRPQAWAKNIVAVGGIQGFDTARRSDDRWGGRASIGPASDGRIKPDISQFYGDIYTTQNTGNSAHGNFGGTSGATPAAAGHFGLLFQMWADGVFSGGPGLGRDVFDSRPHASTAKALIINAAFQYEFSGRNHDRTRVHQGWGFPDVKNLYEVAKANGWKLPILIDETRALDPRQTHSYSLAVTSADTPLKATMVYSDPPGLPNSSVHRVNDLTLKVTSPTGTVYWGNNGLREGNWSTPGGSPNTIDTVENVFVQNPEPGAWTIEIVGDEIVQDARVETANIDADYALVVTGGTASTPGNQPPTANAGNDQTADEGATVRLSGSGSDPDGTIASYQWSQVSGPTVNLTTPTTASAGFTAPEVTTDTILTFRLVVTDNGGLTASDQVAITVQDSSVAGGADLVVNTLTPDATTTAAGGTLNYITSALNQGTAASGANFLRLVLSTDAVIDGNDTRLTKPSRKVTALAGGASLSLTGAVQIPANTVPGNYFLGAIIDPKNVANETDETNNTRAIAITVSGATGTKPDLVVTTLSINSTAVAQGTEIGYTVKVLNQGTAEAGENFLRLVLSSNATIGRRDRRLTRPSLVVPVLAAGASHEASGTLTFPANVIPRRYFFGAIVDPSGKVSEINEENNSSSGVAITIAPAVLPTPAR